MYTALTYDFKVCMTDNLLLFLLEVSRAGKIKKHELVCQLIFMFLCISCTYLITICFTLCLKVNVTVPYSSILYTSAYTYVCTYQVAYFLFVVFSVPFCAFVMQLIV